jgi:hypothetical protein
MATSDNRTSKRRKRRKRRKFENQDADMLNDVLPVHLVSRILSCLPTKEAVKTSILSKRWRFLWTTISNLDFSDRNEVDPSFKVVEGTENRKKFIKYVSNVLLQLYPTNSIDKLSIYLKVYRNVLLQIKNWISCAAQRNVKDLDLSLQAYSRIDVSRQLYDCKSLQALRLNFGLHLKIPKQGFVFPNLKSLSLESVSISGIPGAENSPCFPKLVTLCLKLVKYVGNNDCVMKLIRNCPLLKDLTIHRVVERNLSNVDMCIPQLTTVYLACGYVGECFESNVQIEAPIKTLKVKSWKPPYIFIVKNPDSLIRAELCSDGYLLHPNEYYNFQPEQQGKVLKLLETVDKVKYLSLDLHTMHAIKVSKIKLPLFANLIQLEVSLYCKDLYMLESFLNNTINLQKLVVTKICRKCLGDDGRWTEFSHVPKCLISSLKTVEIIGTRDCPGELDMIKIILKFAKVLQKLTLYPYLYERDVEFEFKPYLLHIISAFSRASSFCQVDVKSYLTELYGRTEKYGRAAGRLPA